MLEVIWAVTERGHKQADKVIVFQPLDNTTSFWNEKSATRLSDAGEKKKKSLQLLENNYKAAFPKKNGQRKVNYEIHLMNCIVYIYTLK